MDPIEAQRIPPEVLRPFTRNPVVLLPKPLLYCRVALMASALIGALCLGATLTGHATSGVGRWSAGVCFLLASLAMLGCLGSRLPLQNLGAVMLVSWASAFLGLTLAVKSNVLFGAVVYAEGFGPKILGIVPWQMPFLWLALVLSGRETARLILRPWRRDRHYGYWLVGVAALLVLWTELAVQPFALHVAGWWSFHGSISAPNWLGVPWQVFPSGFFLALLVLAFMSPWLVAKRPIPTPPSLCPLTLWLLLNVGFLIGNARRGLWLATAATVMGMALVASLAWRARAAASAASEDAPRL